MRDAVVAQAYDHNTDIRLITLLKIDYGTGAIYLNDTRNQLVSGGKTYDPFPFRIVLSEQTAEHPPDAQIVIDNTDRSILEALLGVDEAEDEIIATVSLTTNLDTEEIEQGPIEFRMRGVQYDRNQVSASLRYEDRLHDETPILKFSNQNAPGLYR